MSQENVETVRRILAEWENGDFRATAMLLDSEITFETFMPDASENVVAHGTAEFEAFTRDWLAQWRNYRVVGERFREVGQDKVFASVRQVATGQHSGVEVESPGYSVWTLRAGKVIKLSLHYDRDKALEAAGLSEQDAHWRTSPS
jgi:ketosteroid isomerase-like protein